MDKNQSIDLGPLKLSGHSWGHDIKYYNLRAFLNAKGVSFTATLAIAPSGIFLSASLNGNRILKYLNKR
jgi:hypothetical protein